MSSYDDGQGRGIGALAAWQLGRWSAESEAERDSLFEAMRESDSPPAVDVNQLLANNQALAAENARLRDELADYKHNYKRLRAWADQVKPILARRQSEGE